jgi:hypothetical protein
MQDNVESMQNHLHENTYALIFSIYGLARIGMRLVFCHNDDNDNALVIKVMHFNLFAWCRGILDVHGMQISQKWIPVIYAGLPIHANIS